MPALNRADGEGRTRRTPAIPGRLLVLGLLCLVGLCLFTLLVEAPRMEREIGEGVRTVLAEGGHRRMDVAVRGRDVTLTGLVSGRTAADAAVRLASGVDGVRTVRDGTRVEPVSLSWVRLRRGRDGGWRVGGVLPDADSWLVLEESLQRRNPGAGARTARIDRVVDPERSDPGWLDAVDRLLDLVSGMEGGAVELGAGILDVSGTVADPASYPGAVRALETLAMDERLDLVNRVSLRPPG